MGLNQSIKGEKKEFFFKTLLHLERPKMHTHTILAFLSAIE